MLGEIVSTKWKSAFYAASFFVAFLYFAGATAWPATVPGTLEQERASKFSQFAYSKDNQSLDERGRESEPGPVHAGEISQSPRQWQRNQPGPSPQALPRSQWRKIKALYDAQRFSSRVKRRLERRFAKRKWEFKKQQALLEQQRRAYRRKRARYRAREFAAARRHAAKLAHKHAAKPRVHKKDRGSGAPDHVPEDTSR
ncbi:MAG: hypothetical protein WBX25_23100 [Rhodomicrobium sp.]